MNKKQLLSMWTGIIVFVVMGLFPPWIMTIPWDATLKPFAGARYDFEYGFIISHSFEFTSASNGQKNEEEKSIVDSSLIDIRHRIDFPTLIIQWLLLLAITTGVILTFRDKKQ